MCYFDFIKSIPTFILFKLSLNNNWNTFYSNFCVINDVKNVFLYSFCMNDLEMWHKWFLNMRQARNRVLNHIIEPINITWHLMVNKLVKTFIQTLNITPLLVFLKFVHNYYIIQIHIPRLILLYIYLNYPILTFSSSCKPNSCEPKLLR